MKEFFISLILFFGILQLSNINAISQEIQTIDGVKTINNQGSGIWTNNKAELKLIKRAGNIEVEVDENYMFFNPSDIAKDNNGNFYILDSGNYKVKVFDENWEFKFSFGEKGQGPAEFLKPIVMNIDDTGKIYVLDGSNQLIKVFTLKGEFIKTLRVDVKVSNFLFDSNFNFVVYSNSIDYGLLTEPDDLFKN